MGILICRPIALNWDKTLKGHCGDTTSQEIASASINMVLDLSIVILPMPVLWGLQLPLRKKVWLSGVLSIGLWYVRTPVAKATTDLRPYLRVSPDTDRGFAAVFVR